jgi:hypothetical protein
LELNLHRLCCISSKAHLIPLRRHERESGSRESIKHPRGNARLATVTPRKPGLYGWYRPGFTRVQLNRSFQVNQQTFAGITAVAFVSIGQSDCASLGFRPIMSVVAEIHEAS